MSENLLPIFVISSYQKRIVSHSRLEVLWFWWWRHVSTADNN
ncbi:hypothetical protein [Natronolimnobius sp. AArcel1]|nr:hypothetical protein [Natronolimnobius sp. AArcel1]